MLCTQCKTAQMEPKELERGLVASVCPDCQGALVSLMNYRYWLDTHANDVSEVSQDETLEISENESAHSCPKCSRFMTKFQIGVASNQKLDLCTGCDEAWLDRGEWRLLKQLDLHNKLPKIFTDAWQRNIRIKRKEIALDERHEKLLGKDSFVKVKEFKNWLHQQDNVDAIKQYLITTAE
jgi:Zn-finger nucleic acid-binding protein